MSVSYGGDSITFADNSTISSGWTGFKNRIINGGMVIDQRNAGAVKYGQNQQSGIYTVDRWQLYYDNSSANVQVQQSSTVPSGTGFTSSACITINTGSATAANNEFQFRQGIEGYNIADLKWGTSDATNITISFWIRCSLTGSFSLAIQNAGVTSIYVTTYTINQANTWEYKTITIPGPTSGTFYTNNSAGFFLIFDGGSGSNYNVTANTWTTGNKYSVAGTTKLMATTGATMYITGVQVEKGSTASSFEYRPYGTELALCQRYFQTGTAYVSAYRAFAGNWQEYYPINFQVTMRGNPTVTLTNISATLTNASYTTATRTNGFAWGSNITATGQYTRHDTFTAEIEL